jgi:hypothetical protein
MSKVALLKNGAGLRLGDITAVMRKSSLLEDAGCMPDVDEKRGTSMIKHS